MSWLLGQCCAYIGLYRALPCLFFTIYINNFLGSFQLSTLILAYADHLTLVCDGYDKDEVGAQLLIVITVHGLFPK